MREGTQCVAPLEEPTTTTLMPPTSPCPYTHTCPPCCRAPCAGLPPACMFSFFFFLLTSSFVVQSLRSHHLPCRQTCGCPLLPGPATTTAKPHAAQQQHPRHHTWCDDHDRDCNTTRGTMTVTAKPHVVQRRRPRNHTWCKDGDHNTHVAQRPRP